MAARVNTKFILILIIVLGTLGTTVGGFVWWKIKNDASAKIATAEEFLAAGDYRNAERFFGRAVGVEPGNLEYVARWEDAITRIVPNTANEATELFLRYMAIRKYPRDQYPFDVQWHERILDDLAYAAKRVPPFAAQYDQEAGRMLEMIIDPDPSAIRGQLHRGLARFAPAAQAVFDDNDVDEGRRALEAYLAEDPAHAEAWSTLVQGRVAMAQRQRINNEPGRADQEFAAAQAALEEARKHVAGDPLFAIAELTVLREGRNRTGELDETRVRQLLTRLAEAARDMDDSATLSVVADMLHQFRSIDGLPKASSVFGPYLARNPKDYLAQVQAATAYRLDGDFENSRVLLEAVLDAELLPVGFMSQFQMRLREISARELVLVGLSQWEIAEEGERAMHIERMEAARDRLVSMAVEPAADPAVLEAEARIAYVKGQFGIASANFDRLVTQFGQTDLMTLLGAALSLERLNQIGRALAHIDRGLALDPRNPELLERRATYLMRMRRYEEAEETARMLTQVAPGRQSGQLILDDAQSRLAIEGGTAAADDMQAIFRQIEQMISGRKFDEARMRLEELLEEHPDNPRVVYALMAVNWDNGDRDYANALLERGIEEFPEYPQFAQFKRTFAIENPVQRLIQYAQSQFSDPIEQSIEIVTVAHRTARQLANEVERAEREGDDAAASSAKRRMEAMIALGEEHRGIVEGAEPRHPRFVRFRFDEAVEDRNWSVAEEMVQVATEENVDQAGGQVFLGRYEYLRGEHAKAAATLAAAAELLPFDARVQLWLGQALEGLGRYEEALDAFEVAYRNNPNDIAVIFPYIDLLQLTGDHGRALLILQNARRLQVAEAASNEIRNRWLALESQVGDPAIVLRERREMHDNRRDVLAVDPIARQNARALIDFLARQTPTPTTILAQDGSPRYTPREWARLGSQDQDRVRRETRSAWDAEIDEILEALADPMERGLAWHNMKSTVLRMRGDVDGGESVLREYLAGELSTIDRLRGQILLSGFLQAVDRMPEAVEALQEAQRYQDPARLEADRALSQLLMSIGRFGQAAALLETIHSTVPSVEIEYDIVRCLTNIGQVEQARSWLDRIDRSAADEVGLQLLGATLLQVEMELASRRGDDAAATRLYGELGTLLAELRVSAPTQAAPYLMDAQRMLARSRRTGDRTLLDQALRELNSAGSRTSDTRRVSLIRIEVLKEQGNIGQAIVEYQQVLATVPDDRDARLALVDMLVQEQRVPEAMEAMADAVRRSPGSAFWHERYADLVRQVGGDLTVAVEHYRRAVESMRSVTAITKLANALLALPTPDVDGALRYLRQYEDELGDGPEPITVRARARAMKGDRDAAIADLRLAREQFRSYVDAGRRDPSGVTTWIVAVRDVMSTGATFSRQHAEATDAFVRELAGGDLDLFELGALALIWRSVGDEELPRSIDYQRQALSLAVGPDEGRRTELLFTLGSLLHAAGEERAALDAYEEIIRLEPENARALNNAAFYLSESLNDLDGALAYAQRAVDLLPGDWSLRDTLGWIQYKRGAYPEAKNALFRSVQLHETAVNNYHLAAVYVREGDMVNARRYLKRARELNPDSETRAEIDRLADDI